MNEPQADQHTVGERVLNERCLCREVFDHLRDTFGVSPAVRQHLANSRIEFLKAIREVIDERIERLSKTAQHGTKIAVE
jgi:hypothetical protein